MPRPTGGSMNERASANPEDPYRERIAALEVQLSAVRSTLSRALEELSPLGDKVHELIARLAIADDVQRASLTQFTERTAELSQAAQAGRAAIATMRQELAEQRRKDDARAAKISSVEERVLSLESDARLGELRLLVDRLELRLVQKERENESFRVELETRLSVLEASIREPSHPKAAPPLSSISGIGPKLEAKLHAAGVADLEALAELSKEDRQRLAKELGIARSKLDAWCEAARGSRSAG